MLWALRGQGREKQWECDLIKGLRFEGAGRTPVHKAGYFRWHGIEDFKSGGGSGCPRCWGDSNIRGAGLTCGFMEGMAVPQARVQAFHAGQQVRRLGREGMVRAPEAGDWVGGWGTGEQEACTGVGNCRGKCRQVREFIVRAVGSLQVT